MPPVLDLSGLRYSVPAWIRVVGLMFAPDSPKARALFEDTMRELPVAEDGLILSAALETARREMLAAMRDDGIPKGAIAVRIMVMTLTSEGQDVKIDVDVPQPQIPSQGPRSRPNVSKPARLRPRVA